MKIVLALMVAIFLMLSVCTQGLISALAELGAFIAVIAWVLKSKSTTQDTPDSSIEPHV